MFIELGDVMVATKSVEPAINQDLQGKAFP
jgi:hypothetical protein